MINKEYCVEIRYVFYFTLQQLRLYRNKQSRNLINTEYVPQIFKGASNSSRIGCERNISRDFKQSPRISPSVS